MAEENIWYVRIGLTTEEADEFKSWAEEEDRKWAKLAYLVIRDALEKRKRQQTHADQFSFVSLLANLRLNAITGITAISLDRLSAIAHGEKPTDKEIRGLSKVLGLTTEELFLLSRAHFG